jgi:hypothetical protein
MRRNFFSLLFAVAFVAGGLTFVAAENAAIQHGTPKLLHGENTARYLKYTEKAAETEDAVTSESEERGMTQVLSRIKNLLRRAPKNKEAAKLNKEGAKDAVNKVNSIIGTGKKSTELTPQKLKALETYAHDNPDKWLAMSYYVSYVFGISLVVTLLYGTFFLGWRPLGLGGPRYN